MRAVTQYLKSRGFGCVDDSWYSLIHLWQSWYQGKVPAFHCYRQYNGRRKVTRTRKTLGMAKTIPEDWANLALNEKVDIVVSEAAVNERVHQVLEDNNFRVRANQLVELAFALGAGAFVEYLDGDRVRIDYVRAGLIYPLAWDNGEVLDCAFASERAAGKEKQLTLTIHRRDKHGFYLLENHLFRRQGNVLTKLDLPEGVKPEVNTGSAVPLFQLIRPNIVNNVDLNCPMGISVFANAIDQLEGVDLVYDSYQNEFRLGRKRITVPITMTRMAMEEDGFTTPVFDDNDTEFYAVPSMEGAENKIVEHNMELRHEAHEAAIKSGLALLSYKCGMGDDRYSFDQGQVKTAKEVVSDKSDLFQSLKKHELLLERALVGLADAVASLLGLGTGFETVVNFDDSIIEDADSTRQRDLQEVRDGIMQKWEFRKKWYGENERAAKAMCPPDQGRDPYGLV